MKLNTLLLKGKYTGSTYGDVLNKDLNYCEFIVNMKYVSAELKDFQNWLDCNIVEARAKDRLAKISLINERCSK